MQFKTYSLLAAALSLASVTLAQNIDCVQFAAWTLGPDADEAGSTFAGYVLDNEYQVCEATNTPSSNTDFTCNPGVTLDVDYINASIGTAVYQGSPDGVKYYLGIQESDPPPSGYLTFWSGHGGICSQAQLG